jgi:RIO kinase 1
MRLPESLASLLDQGILSEVVRPLMSGKEAQVYLVMLRGKPAVAKVYKDAARRSFKNRSDYTEGRKVRNTRDQRAMERGSKYGKGRDEEAWRSAEVDVIYRLRSAGVRVPEPYLFIDGVLVMELVTDGHGNPAPRLAEASLDRFQARAVFDSLLRSAVKMLCAGVVHGDLSDFNVLLAPEGPVIIDFPQAVDPSHNPNARKLLVRDVDNLVRFLARFEPIPRLPFGEEMWDLYSRSRLTPDTVLRGQLKTSRRPVDTSRVLSEIGDANRDEQRRREGSTAVPRKREVIIMQPATPPSRGRGNRPPQNGGGRPAGPPRGQGGRPQNGPPPRRRGNPSG